MEDHTTHKKYMRRCLELAAKGLGRVAPNPMVGCVIVHNDQIIGEGYHQEYGKPHAEVNAIASVQNQALLKESTLYVNLEPCSHTGKTPPCSQLIIEMGIPHVVVGAPDPNQIVSGRGIEAIKSAGHSIITGIMQQECLELNKRFFTFHQKQRPYVILKWARTKDGFIDIIRDTPEKGDINWITDAKARTLVHKWRSEEQAILVGSETVLKDNPSLTVREVPGRNPTRIIVDRRNRVTPDHSVRDTSAGTIIMSRENKMRKNVEWFALDDGIPIIPQMLEILHEVEIISVIVEGGAFTLNRFIESGLWDEARVFTGNIEFGSGVAAPELAIQPAEKREISTAQLSVYYNN
jgi:diaminohydroxyphosphoribosylaminopyrimidine deaminase/5-amino-6-(5-phosphoribosylamino)uracil reductase